MKKTGLEIVEMIARDEAPKKILAIDFAEEFEWDKERVDYYDEDDTRLLILNNLDSEFEIIEEPKVWKPKDSEEYYTIEHNMEICKRYNFNSYLTEENFEIGNCFKTKEEAQKHLKKIKIYMQLKRFAEEHNTEKDNCANIVLMNNGKLETYTDIDVKGMGIIYFSSHTIAKQAIKEIGEDNIKKLFEED